MTTVGDRLYEMGGVPVGGGPDYIITGNVYFVNSTGGSPGHSGKKPAAAMATIDQAVGKCTANNGDVIYVMPGHAENIATTTSLDVDVAGITIVGLGRGESRPILTQTATDAYVDVAAANTTIKNILFKAGVNTGTVAMLQIQADDCLVENCEFKNVSSTLHTNHFIETSATSNAADRLTISGCRFFAVSADADCDSAISLPGVQDSVLIENNLIVGTFDDAGIHNVTGKTCTNLQIIGNVVENTQAGDHAIEIVSACTGNCVNNRLYATTTAALLDPGSLKCTGNRGSLGVDQADFDVPNCGATEPRLTKHTTAAMEGGTFDVGDHPTLFTVTGTVYARCWAVVATGVTSASDTGTIELGTTDDLDAFIATTTVGSGTLAAGDVWTQSTVEGDSGPLGDDGAYVLCNGTLIECDVNTNNMTAGVMDVYCQWIPVSADGNVVAA